MAAASKSREAKLTISPLNLSALPACWVLAVKALRSICMDPILPFLISRSAIPV